MRFLIFLLIPPILIVAFALVLEFVPLPAPFPPSGARGRHLLSAVCTGLVGILYVVTLTLYVIGSFARAGRALDPLLLVRGFTWQSYSLFGSHYQGEIGQKQFDVYYLPARFLRPDVLDVHVRARARSAMAIGHRRPPLECRGCRPLPYDDAAFSQLHLLAQEAEQARRLLEDPRGRGAVTELMADPAGLGLREIYLQPDRVWFRAHIPHESSIPVSWFDNLAILAEVVEATP